MAQSGKIPITTWLFPIAALVLFGVATLAGFTQSFSPTPVGFVLALMLIPVLFGTVFAAVHHAEIIAHRTGEPYGTLILTAAVTVIEVALIASVMLSNDASPMLARDTVYAVIMIVCNGLVGLCILVGGVRHGEQGFRTRGAASYLLVLAPMAVLTLILPSHTQAEPGPVYSASQLVFVSVISLALYAAFLYIQTVRHRDYFIVIGDKDETAHPQVSDRELWLGLFWLVVALAGVILLSKKFSLVIEAGVVSAGMPRAVIGIIVALVILLPEGVAAVLAARRDQLQKSVNLALGSSLATIGMTMPAVGAMSLIFNKPLILGISAADQILLAVTLLVSLITFGGGRTNILAGVAHLVLFATFVFLAMVP
ncbi:MAG: calcium:proton antiporter [Beijerinckiaceae bacterium]